MTPKARDTQSVVQWRQLELLQCGFSPALARRVAKDQGYEALVVQILSPIDGSDRLAEARK